MFRVEICFHIRYLEIQIYIMNKSVLVNDEFEQTILGKNELIESEQQSRRVRIGMRR